VTHEEYSGLERAKIMREGLRQFNVRIANGGGKQADRQISY
jgi:hypothetical protein